MIILMKIKDRINKKKRHDPEEHLMAKICSKCIHLYKFIGYTRSYNSGYFLDLTHIRSKRYAIDSFCVRYSFMYSKLSPLHMLRNTLLVLDCINFQDLEKQDVFLSEIQF